MSGSGNPRTYLVGADRAPAAAGRRPGSAPATTPGGHTPWGARVMRSDRAVVLLGALALDLAFGEPPAACHPVVWIGRATGALEHRAPGSAVVCGPWPTFAWGALTTAVVVGAAWLGARQAEALAERLPAAPRWLLAAWLLKTTLSLRTLLDAAERVRRALARGDLAGARAGLRWLVSRETDDLPPPLLAAAAIESVAENLSDSLVAPLLAYALGGLPGAFAYRAANTLDAMLGYRGRYEWLGKVPARLDDALNLLPARLTAGLLALAAGACGLDGRAAARIARRDGPRTPSPNAGWPMAAMAGALGLELEKRGHYVLGQGGRLPSAGDIRRAEGIALGAAGLATLLALALARLGARA